MSEVPAQIERYVGRDAPLPEVPAMGRARQTAARQGLPLHTHDVYELCLIIRGQVNWTIAGEDLTVSAGEATLCHPGQLHGSRAGVFEPCELAWMQFDTRQGIDRELAEDLAAVTTQGWRWSEDLLACHEQLLVECRAVRPHRLAMSRAVLHQLLIAVVRQGGEGGRCDTGRVPRPVQRVIDFVHAHPRERVSVEAMLQHSGVSRTQLHNLFGRHLGQSPGNYALRHRLRQAQLALYETDAPVIDVALDFGFSSSQHFSTAFRRVFGMTPQSCRAEPAL